MSLFSEWQRHVDPAAIRAASSPLGWAGLAAVALAIMAAGSFAPSVREFFQLSFWPALAFALPPFLLGPLIAPLYDRGVISDDLFGALTLFTACLLKLFSGALVAFSAGPGAAVMASVPLATIAYHGHLYRSTLRNPLDLILSIAMLGASTALALDSLHLSIFGVVAPAAIGGNWVLGHLAMQTQLEHERQDGLRAAIHAQVLAEGAYRAEELAESLVLMMQNNHDATSVLQAAIANVERLEAGDPLHPVEAARLREVLERLQELLDEARVVGETQKPTRVETKRVPVSHSLMTITSEMALRFPKTRFSYELQGRSAGDLFVEISGGESGLNRVLANLVANAAQGDGRRGAANVEVCVELQDRVDAVRIQVLDDGPGFSPDQLARSIVGFESGKPDGMGLGLYTVERLVRASGGSLQRANRPSGGAEVSVFLNGGVVQ